MSRRQTLSFELASYEVIDLLVGNNIYADPPRVVIRELVQNAVDACRLRRALEPDYVPAITVAHRPGRLTVQDNGIGMTEEMIRNYFLRVGRSYYSSADFRQRYGGVAFAPIARFGIGALSAFLIGNELAVTTRHHDPVAAPVRLDIEGLHSSIVVSDPPPDTPVGTRLELALRPEIAYPDLAAAVRHVARHLEMPIRVEQEGRGSQVIPADDGSAYRRELLDPLNYLLLDPARRHQVRTRRLTFADGGMEGFIEYLYLETPGRLRLPWLDRTRSLIDVYTENAPRAVSLDGIYVGDQLPCFFAGPGVAYDLNLRSRPLGVSLRLDRRAFVEDLPYRKLVERLDSVLIGDLVELLQGARLTPVQQAESLAALVDVRRLRQHSDATGAQAAWEAIAGLPVFPLRAGGARTWTTWAAFDACPEVARVPVGHGRVHFPESADHQVDDFWWDRHFRLAAHLAAGSLPFYTSLDANPVADAFLERHYAPVRMVVADRFGVSYPVYRRGAPAPPTLGGLPALPCAGSAAAVTYGAAGWVLNAGHPAVAAALATAPESPERVAAEKPWRDLTRRLGALPGASEAAAAGADLPAHDCSQWWEGEWERFLLSGGNG